MEIKLMYTIGNLHGGYAHAVEAERQFGSVDIHGPFSSENQANNYAHELIKQQDRVALNGPLKSVKVVKVELPQVGKHIVLNADGEYEYAV